MVLWEKHFKATSFPIRKGSAGQDDTRDFGENRGESDSWILQRIQVQEVLGRDVVFHGYFSQRIARVRAADGSL